VNLRKKGVLLIIGFARAASADDVIEVVVRAEPIARPPKEPSVAGSVIPEERLRAPGLQASDVLRTQPGVAVHETGGYGSLSTAMIRGATAAQTPVYLAGIRLNDDVGGTADLSLIPLWLVHRVEIYRSHAPLAGDQLGIGGAIFFEPRRPKTTEAGVGAMVGSFGSRALWAQGGVGNEEASAFVGVRGEAADNDYLFVNNRGAAFDPSQFRTERRQNADAQTIDVWAMGSLRLGQNGRADLLANDVEREQGLPGLIFPNTAARATLKRRLAGLTARVPCASEGCELIATSSGVVSHAAYDDPLHEVGLGTTALEQGATRVENGFVVRWALSDHFAVAPTVRGSIERLDIEGANFTPLHAQRVFSRMALQGEWLVSDDVELRALVSAECNGTSRSGRPPWSAPGDAAGPTDGSAACNRFQPSGRIGAEIGHAPLSLLANVGRYARMPTLSELYGLSGSVRGNSGLEAETGVSAEIGVRAAARSTSERAGVAADLFGFVRKVDDLIAYQGSNRYIVPFNVGSARVAGLEFLGSYRPAPFALFELSATLLDPRNTSPGGLANDLLPYRSRLTLVPRIELRSKLFADPVDAGRLSVSYFYESSRYADQAGLVTIPEQGWMDVEAEVGAFGEHVLLRGRLANVLNQTRFDLVGYPLPGRAAFVSFELKW
jgi:iron complex outermembrane receptor protein